MILCLVNDNGVENEEFVKMYLSIVESPKRRGRPLGRWEDKVKEYVSERGVRRNGLEWARKECMDIGRVGGLSNMATPLGNASRVIFTF